ncbi:MAG: EamA family transporter [Candidatus Accumulibacter sp.]|jgi:drug/metabolite transporter (DMT)-like permease|nr:EamA family transporter [Accumulibacter sp.]
MDSHVFLAVILAGALHAGWNLIIKLDMDRFLALFLIQTLMGVMGLAMLAVFPLAASASWPYALASGAIHLGYYTFLSKSYRVGDLSQVYPIARGGAPLLTFIGVFVLLGEALKPAAAFGVFMLIAGIWLTARACGKALKLDGMTIVCALGTSVFIAAYTLVDGLGGRASDSIGSYSALVFVLDALFLFIFGVATRGIGIVRQIAPAWKLGVLGAALSAGAYWIVIWAMSVAHIAAVAALRETGIVFVVIMSALVLKEKVTPLRGFGALIIIVGAAALRLA